ncbi:MAG: transposase [Bacteroidaceae bacterium]|nr:transposase [Bacteroidaceae bacterium]
MDTIKKGKRNGYSRYFCKNCGSYFTDRRPHISEKNMFVWFRRWVREKQSISQIAQESGHSERTLKRYFYKVLPTCPTWQIQKREKVNLLVDGTYFTNKVCLLLYRDNNIQMTILYRLAQREGLRDLMEDLQAIKDVGIEVESVTCDGAANILKAVRNVFPEAIIQRCTFHIANEVCLWLTKKPKSEAAKELRELVGYLNKVSTHEEAQLWMRAFVDWKTKFNSFINQKTTDEQSGRWWYTHKTLHQSASHIERAMPNMFCYLFSPKIPKTSNSIESFFGHLKDHLRLHRGLSNKHFKDFIKWYLFLQSNEGKVTKNRGKKI